METLSKHKMFRIFDITIYLPGKKIPPAFEAEAEVGGPWFFQPVLWCPGNWGSLMANRRGFPDIFSPGYETQKKCLKAANDWEKRVRKGCVNVRDIEYMTIKLDSFHSIFR